MTDDARLLAILAKGVRRSQITLAIGGLVMLGVSVGSITGYEISSPTGSDQLNLRGEIILGILVVLVGLYGLLFFYMGISGGARHRNFIELLTENPQKIARIYGARISNPTGYAVKIYSIAPGQEAQLAGRRRRALIIIERHTTSGIARAFGFHKDMIRVRPNEVAGLLDYLRQFAPNALGPPQPVRRTRPAKPPG